MNQGEGFAQERYFLKDFVRQQVDFRLTGQAKGMPAPPLQKPVGPGQPLFDLPEGRQCLFDNCEMPLAKAIDQRCSSRDFNPGELSVAELSALLWATQGVLGLAGPESCLRTVPSAGARHSFETYLAISQVAGLVPGIYRYLPFDHQLACIAKSPQIASKAAVACLRQGFVGGSAVTFFWTTIPARMEWRYGQAAHKVIALDAGHVCQNLYLACAGMDLGVCAIAAYDQEACDTLLQVDGEDEFTIYIAAVGRS